MKGIGKVTLVGAGPGNGGLISRRGEKALAGAQVVLTDRLVGADILALIPQGAEVVDVGKKSGCHPIPQQEINRILAEKAGEGKRVVRLKGGDPYLFGRGAEELEEVIRAGIPWEVVPGVTASIAVPSWAGIPVTHREHSSSLHIFTGHGRAGGIPSLDYKSIVALKGTLVFMMGFTAMESILDELLRAGMDPATPAALIQDGTLPGQKKVTATVADLPGRAREEAIKPPALLVVGQVCGLSGKLDWHARLPLHGKAVLVTRPRSAGSALADALEDLGAGVIRFPCIRLLPREGLMLPELAAYGWVIFTSAFGVSLFFQQLRKEKLDIRSLAGLKIAAIGNGTAEEIKSHGLLIDYVPEVFDAKHLAEGLSAQIAPGERALLFRAATGTPELPDTLERCGVPYTDLAAYDTLYQSPAAPWIKKQLLQGEIDYVTFTSASTVEGFVGVLGREIVDKASFMGICIGAQTACAARSHGIPLLVSREPATDSMVEEILRHAGKGTES